MSQSKVNEFIERGKYKQSERDIDGAYEEYSSLIKHYPNYVEGYSLRGYLNLWYFCEFEDAKNDFKKALDIEPKHASACYGYGSVLCKLGEIKEGLKFLVKSAEIKPSGSIYDEIGENKLYLKENQEALEAFINSAEIELKDKYCFYENAIESFDKAIKLLVQKKAYKDAIKYLNKIIEIRKLAEIEDYEPNDYDEDECKDFYDPCFEIKLIGFCLYLSGDFEGSINKLNECIKKFLNSEKEILLFESYILRGQAFIKCNKRQDANSDWDKVSFLEFFGNQISILDHFEEYVFNNYAVKIEFKECRDYFLKIDI